MMQKKLELNLIYSTLNFLTQGIFLHVSFTEKNTALPKLIYFSGKKFQFRIFFYFYRVCTAFIEKTKKKMNELQFYGRSDILS